MQGLAPEHINIRNDLVNVISLDYIRRVAKRVLDPERLHFVVVGQPDGLESAKD